MALVIVMDILRKTYEQNRHCLMTCMLCYKQRYRNNHMKDVWPLIWKKVCTPIFMLLLSNSSSSSSIKLTPSLFEEKKKEEEENQWGFWLEDTVNKK